MNRDESPLRLPEEPPKFINEDIIAPIDSRANGTWFALDKRNGKIACLLNRYDEVSKNTQYSSRGEIAIKALKSGINSLELSKYRPFRLVTASKGLIEKFEYDGKKLTSEKYENLDWHFFSSSSWNEKEVINYRKKLFNEWLKDRKFKDKMPTYNLYREDSTKRYSPLVQRDNAETLSITSALVRFDNSEVDADLKYLDYDDIKEITKDKKT
jgi:uncharacterized protein with NRDE domain